MNTTTLPSPNSDTLAKRAVQLAFFTIAYNLIEGFVSIGFGVSEDSMALAGFGVDSLIEVASAGIVLWRLKGEFRGGSALSIEREKRATLAIGTLFILLAAVTILASGQQLLSGSHPETTVPGLVISALSLSFMYFLWSAKKKVGKALDSPTVLKDADCSLACIKLSVILFGGSLVFWIAPNLWWADAAAGLLLSFLIAKEGFETISAARKPEFSGGCGCSH